MKAGWIETPKMMVERQAEPEERSIERAARAPILIGEGDGGAEIGEGCRPGRESRIFFDLANVVVHKGCGENIAVEQEDPGEAEDCEAEIGMGEAPPFKGSPR